MTNFNGLISHMYLDLGVKARTALLPTKPNLQFLQPPPNSLPFPVYEQTLQPSPV